ncbi:hypothetical protein EDEG_02051 [Edhazardia aedis USNM 41457]|uniref:Uncharacterized protein n=1 Tax=Edhazardia aedis (strain USNM 41457) TaxID=1003232 RepID=J9DM06_EDHAE|nr:hypothetical protein EDEG_02051 [Edhazardia aedis USNM 41457]|eukprot:EJW03620.1 hypothetical protein EDEG_02051 [Edhazardia aedis USNM 41457]
MLLLLCLLFFTPAKIYNSETENSVNHICYNINPQYIDINCYKFFINRVRQSILSMKNEHEKEYTKKLIFPNDKDVYLTYENYKKIVVFHANFLASVFEYEEFFVSEKGIQENKSVFKKNEQGRYESNLFIDYRVEVPSMSKNLEYYGFVRHIFENSELYQQFMINILEAFFSYKFFVDNDVVNSSIFLKNVRPYIENILYEQINIELSSGFSKIYFENSYLFTDPEKLSAFIKDSVDSCLNKNKTHCNIYFKCCKEILISDLLTNSYHRNLNDKTENLSQSQLLYFKRFISNKIESLLSGSSKTFKSNSHDKAIAEQILLNQHKVYQQFLLNLKKKCYKLHSGKATTTNNQEVLEFVEISQKDASNFKIKDATDPEYKYDLNHTKKAFDSQPEICNKKPFISQNREKITKKTIKLCIHVEFYNFINYDTILEIAFAHDIAHTFCPAQIPIVEEFKKNLLNRNNMIKLRELIMSNIVKSIRNICSHAVISENICIQTNNFILNCIICAEYKK